MIVYSLHGERVAEIVARGAPLDSDGRLSELIEEVRGSNAQWVVIPAERLSKDLFRLAAKAAAFVEKFVGSKLRLAILGEVETCDALAALAQETGDEAVLFLRDCNELHAHLAPAKRTSPAA